ncbi:G2/M phase-specific E3 ubiquitin-protein ligase-like [Montipora capricornis]|uniref:G2/M phase-specific E3 ubiquitin-protein ligase-like n=1 Tax=Montipora capricornis TaxID=246305 RepID=UPI0035F1824F
MSECENVPNLLEEDDEINFHGFGDTCDQVTLDDILPLRSLTSEPLASFVLLPVPDSPPEQLLQGDDTGSSKETSPHKQTDGGTPSTKDTGRQMVNAVCNDKHIGNEVILSYKYVVAIGRFLTALPWPTIESRAKSRATTCQEGKAAPFFHGNVHTGNTLISRKMITLTHSFLKAPSVKVISKWKRQSSHLQEEVNSLAMELFAGDRMDPNNQQLVNIRRSRVWQDACRAFSASTFNVARGISVMLIGESGVDRGGPRREFYRLLVEAVCSTSGILEGSDGNKIPLHNCAALKVKKFFLLGVMAGMLMLDGGPGLPVFSASVFHYIATDSILCGSMEDVPDPMVRHYLFVVDRRLDITVEYIRQLFEPSFSETGSNARLVEEDLIYNWEEYLKEMENEGKVLGSETEVNLKDLFVFLTGSDRIPPMGFTRKGKIAFDHRDNSQELRFPSVSTCQPILQLPMCDDLTQDYDSFEEKMNLAVLGSVGFGNL